MKTSIRALAAAALVVSLAATVAAHELTGTVRVKEAGAVAQPRAGIVVWVEGVPEKARPRPGVFSMTSKKKAFEPHVVVVPVGSSVAFPNLDPIFHNVFSVSRTKRFDLGLYKSGASKDVQFDQPGLVRVYCNIHSSMIGYVMVVDGPYATTDADGGFRIADLPPGSYTLHVWDERAGETTRSITVGKTTAPLAIQLDASGYRAKPHLNKYGKRYAKGASDERY